MYQNVKCTLFKLLFTSTLFLLDPGAGMSVFNLSLHHVFLCGKHLTPKV